MPRSLLCVSALALLGATASLLCASGVNLGPASLAKTLVPLERAPVVDGTIHDAEWEGALYLGKFTNASGAVATPETEAWVAIRDQTLYVAFRCQEPLPGGIRTRIIQDEKDAAVWTDDSVDFYIDTQNLRRSFFRITVNAQGTLYDAEGNDDQDNPNWESAAVARTRIYDTYWEAEIAIPMESLYHALEAGEVFSVNAGRFRHAAGVREISGLSGRFMRSLRNFTPVLVRAPVEDGALSVASTRRGPFLSGAQALWEFEVFNAGADTVALTARFPRGSAAPVALEAQPGRNRFELPVAADAVEAMSEIVLERDGRPLFTSAYAVREPEDRQRIRPVDEPLFAELTEPLQDGLAADGFVVWGHDFNSRDLALRAGFPYAVADVVETASGEGAIVVMLSSQLDGGIGQLRRAHGVRSIVRLDNRAAIEKGAMTAPRRMVWPLDPLAVEALLEDARGVIEKAKTDESIWGLFAGDETFVHAIRALNYFLEKGPEAFPQLKQMDEEVKSGFGGGVYGLPTSSRDTNPYRWIATYRWLFAGLADVYGQIRTMVQEECPRLKIMAWNNQSGHFAYELGRWEPLFDIMTGQLYPSLNPNRDLFGFNTKLIADLAGIEEVWPCPHVEHYAANFTVEETLQQLSEMFAAGATGMHLYSVDTKGSRANSGWFNTDRFGAPERWEAVMGVARLLQEQPFRVRQMPPDTLIFYSNPSYQGQGGERPTTNEVEWIYNILGPTLKGSVAFADEHRLKTRAGYLDDFKTVYIPYAPIVDDAEFEVLEHFVRNGGTLVVCDPGAFKNRSDGSARKAGGIIVSTDKDSETFKVGKGQVVAFKRNPVRWPTVLNDANRIAAFRDIQSSAGAVLDNPVWRFRLPDAEPYRHTFPEEVCLTGNYFKWVLSEPEARNNSAVGGYYRLSRSISGEPANTDIPFEKGKLTDRISAINLPVDASPNLSTLRWMTKEPVQVTYVFNRPVTASTLRLYYRGTLPAGMCEVLDADGNWVPVADWQLTVPASEGDIVETVVALTPLRASQYRLTFHATASGSAFQLAETDLWGSE